MKGFAEKAWRNDWTLAGLIVLVNIVLSLPALGALEYLRHTEADRTLIGWEMYQGGDYLIPHLLGDNYITKPPLFYWLLAGMFSMTGAPLEWASRLVSLLGASLLLGAHYVFLKNAGLVSRTALLSAVVLGTNFAFFTSSVEAEIDMTFLVLCAISMHLAYLSINAKRKALCVLACWFFAGLGFFTKGPPVIVFLALSLGLFVLVETWRRPERSRLSYFLRQAFPHLTGALLLASLISLWVFLLQQRISSTDLLLYFRQEILQRFKADPLAMQRGRGFFFYFPHLAGSLFPWSLLLLGFLKRESDTRISASDQSRNFQTFCLCATLPALLVFSLSSGKSGRYILPVFPFLSCLIALGAERLALVFNAKSRVFKRSILVLAMLLLAARLGFAWIYAPIRNQKLSVRSVATAINAALPAGQPVYILEMFERWLPYYLVRAERPVYRLTPSHAARYALSKDEGALIHILLNADSESWRISEITALDPSARELARYTVHKKVFALWEMDQRRSSGLSLRRLFPDRISSPGQQDSPA